MIIISMPSFTIQTISYGFAIWYRCDFGILRYSGRLTVCIYSEAMPNILVVMVAMCLCVCGYVMICASLTWR